jgi:hypothetical protein
MRGLLIALVFAMTTGCGSSERKASGFLSDYSSLRDSTRVDGAKVYLKPGLDLSKYDKFLVRPVGVQFAAEDKPGAIDPEVISELTKYLHQQVVTELAANQYRIVNQPGPGVLDLRIAVTHLKKAEPVLNIHPATKLSGLGLGGASIEAEAFDAATGQRQFAFMHTRAGDRLTIVEGLQEWGHAKQAMDFWAKTLVDRVNEAHGMTRQK